MQPRPGNKGMLVILKVAFAALLGFAVLSPGFAPRADSCTCKADASSLSMVPHAEDCECKAKTQL